jgi:hypothetical protein
MARKEGRKISLLELCFHFEDLFGITKVPVAERKLD